MGKKVRVRGGLKEKGRRALLVREGEARELGEGLGDRGLDWHDQRGEGKGGACHWGMGGRGLGWATRIEGEDGYSGTRGQGGRGE